MRFPRPDARAAAVVATLAAFSLLVALIVGHRQGLLGVVLGLLCVLLAIIAGVSVAAAREQADRERAGPTAAAAEPADGLSDIDADTLETLDNREAIRAMRDRRRGRPRSATDEGR